MRYRIGARVAFIKGELHEAHPDYYPPEGTVGTVLHDYGAVVHVQWPKGSIRVPGADADWKRQGFLEKTRVKPEA